MRERGPLVAAVVEAAVCENSKLKRSKGDLFEGDDMVGPLK